LVFARIDFRQLNQGLLLANSNGDAAFIAKALSSIDRAKKFLALPGSAWV
jgi:hypothetical protein